MKVLFDIAHPAEVHYFKGLILDLQNSGHRVIITARDKDVTFKLLKSYGFDFLDFGKSGSGVLAKLFFLFKSEWKALVTLIRVRPDLCMSMGTANFAHASFLLRIPYIAIDDSEHAKANRFLYKPFSIRIFTPKCFELDLGKKQFRMDSVMELFYLHPAQLAKWTQKIDEPLFKEKYAIVRFISWDAFHDLGKSSLTFDKLKFVEDLSRTMRVLVSHEGTMPAQFEAYSLKAGPEDYHSYLANAELYIGEGATSASECAMLGVPAIYLNPISLGYIKQEEEWGLLWDFGKKVDLPQAIFELIKDSDLKNKVMSKREKLLNQLIDPTAFLFWYITEFPQSEKKITEDPNFQYKFR